MNRTRVRLTAKHWATIYRALEFASPSEDAELTEEQARASVRVLRKIGFEGMAAAKRGVAPVRAKR